MTTITMMTEQGMSTEVSKVMMGGGGGEGGPLLSLG